jgi:hypothetical protein
MTLPMSEKLENSTTEDIFANQESHGSDSDVEKPSGGPEAVAAIDPKKEKALLKKVDCVSR